MARILIVDDEPSFCDLLRTLLISHNHEVLTAYSGRDALDAFMQLRPHFTLLDLRMPGMNGIEVLKLIRRMDPKATVMILTAWGSDELEQQARQLGAIDFLSKALSFDTLVRTMEHVLKPGKTAMAAKPEKDTILLVDDNAQTRERFGQVLRQGGYEVRLAPDVFAAMKVIEKEQPRFVVVDLEMSDRKGVEVLQRLWARNYTGGLILMTSNQNDPLLREAPDLTSVDVLGKPVDPEKLLVAIQVGLVHLRQ